MKKVIYVVIFLYATVGFSQTRWDFALTVYIPMNECLDTTTSHLIATLNNREQQKETYAFIGYYEHYFTFYNDSITYTRKMREKRFEDLPIIYVVQKVKACLDTLQIEDGSKDILMENKRYICLYHTSLKDCFSLYENSATHKLSIWDIKEMIVLFKNRFHPEMVFCK